MAEDVGHAREGSALAGLVLAMLLLAALSMGILGMITDAHRQYVTLIETSRSLSVADAGLEWAIRAGRSTSGNFGFAGGTFQVTLSGQPGDVAAGADAGASDRVKVYAASAHWTVTGRVGNGKRVIEEGTASARSDTATITAAAAVRGIAAGDLDGDGDNDLVWGMNSATSNLQVFLNDGEASFTQAASSPYDADSAVAAVALSDMDADGDLDLVCIDNGASPYRMEVWKNNGSAVFTRSSMNSLTPGKGVCLSVLDVDGDGDPDVVVGTDDCRFHVWTNDGAGVLTRIANPAVNDGTKPNGIVLSDVDGDGDNDAMLVTQGGNLEKWLNNGSGTFTYSATNALAGTGLSLAAGNFDGASGIDMLVGESGKTAQTFFNNGSGTFSLNAAVTTSGDVYAAALYDTDGDGDLDAVFGEVTSDALEIFANGGSGTFTSDMTFATGGPCRAAAAADFNYGA